MESVLYPPCLFNGFPLKKKNNEWDSEIFPSFHTCRVFQAVWLFQAIVHPVFTLGQSLEDSANVWFNIKRIVRGSVCHMLLT